MKNIIFKGVIMCILAGSSNAAIAQLKKQQKQRLDTIYIKETEKLSPAKVLHAEPLFVDLIRDLGARKGEKEWNIGLGLTDNNKFDSYDALVEYEFAPINRLGFEVELPFTFYYRNNGMMPSDSIPQSKLNSIKLATQYTFFVSEELKTSLAIGYLHELELSSFAQYDKGRMYKGNVYNPFFVAAKRWGHNFHTLIYTGPQMVKHFEAAHLHTKWLINTNFHLMIPGTRNFIGVEFNKELKKDDFDMTIRPQLRVGINEHLLIGIVTGIPVKRENQRFSSFLRLIYEPKNK